MNNKRTMTRNSPTEGISWTWQQVLSNSLRNSNDSSVQALLSEGNVSFSQVYIWVTVSSIILQILASIVFWVRFSVPISLLTILNLIKDCVLVGVIAPISIVVFTGLIHILARLFGGKGTFQRFFITYVGYNLRPGLLYAITILIWQASGIKAVVYLGVLLSFYLVIVPITKAIKAHYRFHWIGAFLVGFLAQVVALFLLAGLFIVFNPNAVPR